jgi:hypothetical protein
MRLRGVTGAALCCLALVGCTGSESSPDERAGEVEPAVAGLTDWRPSADAPQFCTVLAGAEHVDDIPGAVGHLLADPTDTRQAWRLTQSSGELRDARDAVRRESGHADLAVALDDLVETLALAASGQVDEATSERIADGLAAVGRHAQPVCEFPT